MADAGIQPVPLAYLAAVPLFNMAGIGANILILLCCSGSGGMWRDWLMHWALMNQPQFQRAAGISAGLAARWFPHIDAAMKEFSITSAIDRAMFIAQCGHESTSFTQMVESFNYSVAGWLVL
jgi:hypothetical protein